MRILLILFLLLASIASSAQFSSCVDSSRQKDRYHACNTPQYEPVCGCDQVTYRNACAAEWWGGLINNGFNKGWVDGTICGNFHIDLVPTAVLNFPAKFQAYIRNISNLSIPISIYIYDSFGKLQYTWFDVTTQDGLFPFPDALEIPAHNFPKGIYSLIAVINNEKQYIKFAVIKQ